MRCPVFRKEVYLEIHAERLEASAGAPPAPAEDVENR